MSNLFQIIWIKHSNKRPLRSCPPKAETLPVQNLRSNIRAQVQSDSTRQAISWKFENKMLPSMSKNIWVKCGSEGSYCFNSQGSKNWGVSDLPKEVQTEMQSCSTHQTSSQQSNDEMLWMWFKFCSKNFSSKSRQSGSQNVKNIWMWHLPMEI